MVKTYTPSDYPSVPSCIKDKIWNTATINVEAKKENQIKYIIAEVCIDKNKVLLVKDPDLCEATCAAICAGGTSAVIGYTSCIGVCSGISGGLGALACPGYAVRSQD